MTQAGVARRQAVGEPISVPAQIQGPLSEGSVEVRGPEVYRRGRASGWAWTSQDSELLPGIRTASRVRTYMEGLCVLQPVGKHPRAPSLGSPSAASSPRNPPLPRSTNRFEGQRWSWEIPVVAPGCLAGLCFHLAQCLTQSGAP